MKMQIWAFYLIRIICYILWRGGGIYVYYRWNYYIFFGFYIMFLQGSKFKW